MRERTSRGGFTNKALIISVITERYL